MAGKLTPAAQVRLGAITELLREVQRVHGLVEQYAGARVNQEQLAFAVKRTFGRLKLRFMGSGYDDLAQLAGSMEVAAGRGASQRTKARILREGVASMQFQLELDERTTRRDGTVETDTRTGSDD